MIGSQSIQPRISLLLTMVHFNLQAPCAQWHSKGLYGAELADFWWSHPQLVARSPTDQFTPGAFLQNSYDIIFAVIRHWLPPRLRRYKIQSHANCVVLLLPIFSPSSLSLPSSHSLSTLLSSWSNSILALPCFSLSASPSRHVLPPMV